MHRDVRLLLDDILAAATKIRDYTAGMDFDDFIKDSKTQDAVVRNLEISGKLLDACLKRYAIQPLKSSGVRSLPFVTFWFMSILE